jgi:hypothetical protein
MTTRNVMLRRNALRRLRAAIRTNSEVVAQFRNQGSFGQSSSFVPLGLTKEVLELQFTTTNNPLAVRTSVPVTLLLDELVLNTVRRRS